MSIEKEVAFDPYHKWLGIPKALRPPTHYQLLGLALGESDLEVIESAAIRQTKFVRDYQVGPYAEHATRILNEIALAEQVLLNPQKRRNYEQKLAGDIARPKPAPRRAEPPRPIPQAAPIQAAPIPPMAVPVSPVAFRPLVAPNLVPQSAPFGAFDGLDADDGGIAGSGNDAVSSRRPDGMSKPLLLGIILGGVGLAAAILVAIAMISLPSTNTDVAHNRKRVDPPRIDESPGPKGAAPKGDSLQKADQEKEIQKGPAPPKTLRPEDSAKSIPEPPNLGLPKEVPPKEVAPKQAPKRTSPIVRKDVPKTDVPGAEHIRKAQAKLLAVYKSDNAKKSIADRAIVAEQMRKDAETAKDDPSDRYVWLLATWNLAASAGKWPLAEEAIDRLDAEFKIDVWDQRAGALEVLVKTGLTQDSGDDALDASLRGLGHALSTDELPLAIRYLDCAKSASSRATSAVHIELARKADAELKLLVQDRDLVAKAREVLKKNPEDAAANLSVGKYEALRRGDWDSAIKHLVKAGDADYAPLAKEDSAPPRDGPSLLKLGSKWWDLSEGEKSLWPSSALKARAAHWYRRAENQVSGLEWIPIPKRLRIADGAPSPFRLEIDRLPEMRTLRGHANRVTAIQADGKRILTSSIDSTIRTWELPNTASPLKAVSKWPIHSFALSPGGRLLVVNDSEKAFVLDPSSFAIICQGASWPGCFWSDSTHLFTIVDKGYRTITFNISLAPPTTTTPLRPSVTTPVRPAVSFVTSDFVKHSMRSSAIHAAEGSDGAANRRFVAIGAETWLCRVNSAGVLREQENLQMPTSKCVAFSSGSTEVVAIGFADGAVRIIDCNTRKVQKTLDLAPVVTRSMAFTPTGDRLLTAGDDGFLRLWDVASGRELHRYSSGSKSATSLLVTPDGANLIIGGSDGIVRIGPVPLADS